MRKKEGELVSDFKISISQESSPFLKWRDFLRVSEMQFSRLYISIEEAY